MTEPDPLEAALANADTIPERERLTGLSAAGLADTVRALKRTTVTLVGSLMIAAGGLLWLSWGATPSIAAAQKWWVGPVALVIAVLAGGATAALTGALATPLALAGRRRGFWFATSVLAWGLRFGFLALVARLAEGAWVIVLLAALGLVMTDRLGVYVNERILLSALTTPSASRWEISAATLAGLVRYRQGLGSTGDSSSSGLEGSALNAASVGFAVSGVGLGVIAATVPLLGWLAVAVASAVERDEVELLSRGDDEVYVRKQVATASVITVLAAVGWATTSL
ncbi:MAG: hypothetical protein ACXIUP_12960 [Microcella sp.]